ncbi:acyl-coenzyme A diphosphatase NUDT19-like [Glandiceps talaboti]
MASMIKPWREAATLFVAAALGRKVGGFNYRVLLLKRHSKATFGDTYVIPGGVIDKADFSNDWHDYFTQKGLNNALKSLLYTRSHSAPILADKNHDTKITNEVAFRLCAIRETFEESGVLLITNPNDQNVQSGRRCSADTSKVMKMGQEELNEWRKRVHNNASEFIELCDTMNCVPNIWALAEWSNWLTPTYLSKRYDTAMFMCCLNSLPYAVHDDKELVDTQWLTPVEAWNYSKIGKLNLPHVYEFQRLRHFNNVNDLNNFMMKREAEGLHRWMGVRYTMTDGRLIALPGDDLYPQKPDVFNKSETEPINQSFEENRQRVQHLNRVEFKNPNELEFHCNVQPLDGHVMPVID